MIIHILIYILSWKVLSWNKNLKRGQSYILTDKFDRLF